jgi:ATPase subunit of ABC transporter with duplicated ATPase domains
MGFLSGGQKSLVVFLGLAYKKPNMLVINKGYNHSSMEAFNYLVELSCTGFQRWNHGCESYQYFVSNMCTELWVVNSGKAAQLPGSFDECKTHTAKTTRVGAGESVQKLTNLNH